MKALWCRLVGHRWVRGRGSLIVLPTVGMGYLWKPTEPTEAAAAEGWGCTRCGRYKPSAARVDSANVMCDARGHD